MENGRSNEHKYNPVVIAIVSAMLGSGGGVALVFNTPLGQQIARPDPFTGTQATSLRLQVENIDDRLTNHLRAHPDEVNQFDRRIVTLEVQYANIISGQLRIIERLDKINGG
jgi:hypothetical protein